MDDVIFSQIKKLLGFEDDYAVFDMDILLHINSIMSTIRQNTADTLPLVEITKSTKWSEVLPPLMDILMVKTFMGLKLRLIFDPPPTSFGITAVQDLAKEYEWRIYAQRDYAKLKG